MHWYEEHGPSQDVIISTRVRLARNITEFPFPHLLKEQEKDQIIQKIIEAVKKIDPVSFRILRLKELSDIEKNTLTERHLINPQLVRGNEDISILVNEEENLSQIILDEDHIRIQSIQPGLQTQKAFERANQLAIALESVLQIAKDKEFGYLTSCPTNVGTGLRISSILHVPGLTRLGQIQALLDSLRRSGYTVRGYYGEGSEEQGQMIQVSNQVTLGQSDQILIKKFEKLMNLLIEQERFARKTWYEREKLTVEDMIYRSKAILENAKLISHKEAFRRLSDLRLGKALGISEMPDYPELLGLTYIIGIGSIQKLTGEALDSAKRDEKRAKLISEILKKENDKNKEESL